MIFIGIDDTDIVGSKGTNQLAKALVAELSENWKCERIVRHQLLDHKMIPYTSKNGSASILVTPRHNSDVSDDEITLLIHSIREVMKRCFVKGSDPGLCVCRKEQISEEVIQFGYRCQFEVVLQEDALSLADQAEIYLEGLGGTNGGIIGALAAVGLACRGNDGRVVQIGEWNEDLVGQQTIAAIQSRGVNVANYVTDELLTDGLVDLNKKLRPNLRDNQIVLFVQKNESDVESGSLYQAIKLP